VAGDPGDVVKIITRARAETGFTPPRCDGTWLNAQVLPASWQRFARMLAGGRASPWSAGEGSAGLPAGPRLRAGPGRSWRPRG
jgi:hypothetical protein